MSSKIFYQILNNSVKLEIISNNKSLLRCNTKLLNKQCLAFASVHELFDKIALNIFEAEIPMSRAMLIQILYDLKNNHIKLTKIFSVMLTLSIGLLN